MGKFNFKEVNWAIMLVLLIVIIVGVVASQLFVVETTKEFDYDDDGVQDNVTVRRLSMPYAEDEEPEDPKEE